MGLSLKLERLKRARKTSRRAPPRTMRAPVRKRGGQYCMAILPSEKTLDQTAYIRMTRGSDMVWPRGGLRCLEHTILLEYCTIFLIAITIKLKLECIFRGCCAKAAQTDRRDRGRGTDCV